MCDEACDGKRHIYNISYHQGSEITMSKTSQILPVEKTKEMEEIPPPPPAKSFGIHEFIHDDSVYSVSFSNDGRLLATGDNANKTTI